MEKTMNKPMSSTGDDASKSSSTDESVARPQQDEKNVDKMGSSEKEATPKSVEAPSSYGQDDMGMRNKENSGGTGKRLEMPSMPQERYKGIHKKDVIQGEAGPTDIPSMQDQDVKSMPNVVDKESKVAGAP
jgi:hypothetical protein